MRRARKLLACRSLLSCRRWAPYSVAGTAAAVVVGAVLLTGAAGSGPVGRAIIQPAPPVSAAAFPLEPRGRPPADGDGLIPNPATPTGTPVGPPSSCTVRFASAGGSSAAVNSWISAHQNAITATTVVCISGTFTSPIHVWGKTSAALLELAPAPGSAAVLDMSRAASGDLNPNEYWGASGGVSIVDSRSVEVYGLTVANLTSHAPGSTPAGIFVTVRSDTAQTGQSVVPHLSACFLDGGSCSDIYVINNTVKNIANTADENYSDPSVCGNGNVDAYGIAVIAASGGSSTQALQHLVIEGNTVTGTRSGQSETVSINGDITGFLAAGNVIHDADNIGLDTIGWETGPAQPSHGYLTGNTVYNIDTYSNAAYGSWQGGRCVPKEENAAGIYDDGGSYIWINGNTVRNANHGIEAGVETPGRKTDHILISDNLVINDPGTSASDPSAGRNPSGTSGISAVAGHDPFALYLDAYGAGAQITNVYVHDNTLQNQSQFFLMPSWGMPVADIAGIWSDVHFWHNTIAGLGPADRYNPLLVVDSRPADGGAGDVVDCNNYQSLTAASQAVNGNFAMPGVSWLKLSGWQQSQRASGYGWDQHSAVGAFSPVCPARSAP